MKSYFEILGRRIVRKHLGDDFGEYWDFGDHGVWKVNENQLSGITKDRFMPAYLKGGWDKAQFNFGDFAAFACEFAPFKVLYFKSWVNDYAPKSNDCGDLQHKLINDMSLYQMIGRGLRIKHRNADCRLFDGKLFDGLNSHTHSHIDINQPAGATSKPEDFSIESLVESVKALREKENRKSAETLVNEILKGVTIDIPILKEQMIENCLRLIKAGK